MDKQHQEQYLENYLPAVVLMFGVIAGAFLMINYLSGVLEKGVFVSIFAILVIGAIVFEWV